MYKNERVFIDLISLRNKIHFNANIEIPIFSSTSALNYVNQYILFVNLYSICGEIKNNLNQTNEGII